MQDFSETELIRETDPLIYFCLDESEKWALVTTKGQGMLKFNLLTKLWYKVMNISSQYSGLIRINLGS